MRPPTIGQAMTALVTAVAAALSRLAERLTFEDRHIELRRACVRVQDRRQVIRRIP